MAKQVVIRHFALQNDELQGTELSQFKISYELALKSTIIRDAIESTNRDMVHYDVSFSNVTNGVNLDLFPELEKLNCSNLWEDIPETYDVRVTDELLQLAIRFDMREHISAIIYKNAKLFSDDLNVMNACIENCGERSMVVLKCIMRIANFRQINVAMFNLPNFIKYSKNSPYALLVNNSSHLLDLAPSYSYTYRFGYNIIVTEVSVSDAHKYPIIFTGEVQKSIDEFIASNRSNLSFDILDTVIPHLGYYDDHKGTSADIYFYTCDRLFNIGYRHRASSDIYLRKINNMDPNEKIKIFYRSLDNYINLSKNKNN